MRILFRDEETGTLSTIAVYYAFYDSVEGDSFLVIYSDDNDEIIVSSSSTHYYIDKNDCDALVRELYQTKRLDLTNYHVSFRDD